MTPQERQMLGELFERLASLENAPRDSEALAAINDGLRRAPNALYPLVQTVLVQDEALKHANAHIRELEDELGIAPAQPQGQGGFLDNMRNTLLSQRERQGSGQGSVPSVRPDAAEHRSSVWGPSAAQPAGYAPAQQPGSPGGSFLGTAAATAVGVMGSSMLMNSMRGLFGGHGGMGQGMGQGSGTGHSAFNPGSQAGSPWEQNSGGGDLSKQAGLDDIGNSAGRGTGETGQRAGLLDTAQNDADLSDDDQDDDTDFDDDNDFDDAGDDTA
jgi:hypothetical protein